METLSNRWMSEAGQASEALEIEHADTSAVGLSRACGCGQPGGYTRRERRILSILADEGLCGQGGLSPRERRILEVLSSQATVRSCRARQAAKGLTGRERSFLILLSKGLK